MRKTAKQRIRPMFFDRADRSPVARRERGYTLVEMLVVVTMISILAGFAIPAYRDYVIRGRIPDATSNLAAFQGKMDQWFWDNRTFQGARIGGKMECPPANVVDDMTSQYFDFSCAAPDATHYTLTATGKNDMAGFRYTINQNGEKATAALPGGWHTHNPNNCWVNRKDGSC
jgi:type IV pilus assembly protein PilE